MQSKKRFTETNIWESEWFMNLDPRQKLFWYYLNDRCDNIGVWTPNFTLTGILLNINGSTEEFADSFLEAVNRDVERIIILDTGAWFLTGFVKFQYCKANPLSSNSPAHKSYIQLMKQRNLWEYFCREQPDVMPIEELNWYEETTIKPAI